MFLNYIDNVLLHSYSFSSNQVVYKKNQFFFYVNEFSHREYFTPNTVQSNSTAKYFIKNMITADISIKKMNLRLYSPKLEVKIEEYE